MTNRKTHKFCYLCQGQGTIIRNGKRMMCTNCGGRGTASINPTRKKDKKSEFDWLDEK